MMMRILVTRPREDGAETAALLAARGHEALLAPLLETRWFEGPDLDFAGVAAILATSANGVRALIRRTSLDPLRPSRAREERRILDIPVFAVGPQTAHEARAAGFSRVENADGDAAALAQAVPRWMAPDAGTLLHVCGEQNSASGGEAAGQPGVTLAERLAGRGYQVHRAILYAVEPRPLPQSALQALRERCVDAALFFSPRSARIFVEQAGGLPLGNVTALCISPATAAALPGGFFGAVRSAARPNQDALLALLD